MAKPDNGICCNVAPGPGGRTTAVIPATPKGPCDDVCPAVVAPGADVTLAGQDCAGAALPATGPAGTITQVVQAPGQVLTVRMCPDPNGGDREVEIGCNAAGERVLVQYDVSTVPPTELARTNLTTGAAEPAGALSVCDTDDIEVVQISACQNGVKVPGFAIIKDGGTGASTVLGEQWRDPATGLWGASLPAGAVVGDCAVAAGTEVVESEEMGCADGVPYSRRRTGFFNGTTGALIAVTYSWVDSDNVASPTAPANFVLGACNPIDRETTVTNEPGCVNGTGFTRVVTTEYSNSVAVAQTIAYRDSDGVSTNVMPVGFTLGECPCDDELGDGCYTSGATVRKWKSFRRADGTVSILDTITGATVAPASIVNCTDAAFDKTLLTTVNATEVYSISSTGLKSWTVRCITAGVTLSVDGESTVMVAGEIISATASDDVTLLDPVTVTAGAGSARVIYTYRAP